MVSVEIKDCQLKPTPAVSCTNASRQQDVIVAACNLLNERLCSGRAETVIYVSLTGRKMPHRPEFVVGCAPGNICETGKHYSYTPVFTSSTYVGQAIQPVKLHGGEREVVVKFDIRPHIGRALDAYLITHACGVLLPNGMTSNAKSGNSRCAWLLALMWRCSFEKAQRESYLSKAYVDRKVNRMFFRGRLDVARQIRENLADASHMACVYREFSPDTIINRTIRRIRKWFQEQDLATGQLSDLEAFDSCLSSLGVPLVDVTPAMIDRITYTRMTESYRPVMQLSRIMLGALGGADKSQCQGESAPAYFVDYSEVWENYLLGVMRKELGAEFSFHSPNDAGDKEFLFDSARSIRPDFIVRDRQGDVVAIMDAKYKNVSQIGDVDSVGNVARDDLYQMTTYLYHYSVEHRPIKGIFLTCGKISQEGLLPVCGRAGHQIGVCAFPLGEVDAEDDWGAARVEKEMTRLAKDFCCRLRAQLMDTVHVVEG